MSKLKLRIPVDVVMRNLFLVMQRIGNGEISVKEANRIAKDAKELRMNNFIKEYE